MYLSGGIIILTTFCLFSLHVSIYLSIYISIYLSIYLFIYVHVSIYLSTVSIFYLQDQIKYSEFQRVDHENIEFDFFTQEVSGYVCLFVYLSIYLHVSIYLPTVVSISIYLSIYLSIHS